MFYYSVWVRSARYHGHDPLTYASADKLQTGAIVQVELQRELVLGVVSAPAGEPRFKTKAITRVFDLPLLPPHLLKLASWMQDYYPAPLGVLAQQLLPVHFSEKQLTKALAAPLASAPVQLDSLPALTKDQQAALEAMTVRDTYLLRGVTGSGKTRLYIEKAAQAVAAGKSAIVLTPEISLTTQLAGNFRAVFGERVLVMHSQQTPAERQAAWLAALVAKEPMIVIGPRSALFSPLVAPGLIILDEAHEAAYKQEQAPQYQAGRVAAVLANLVRGTLILGSATPSVSDYYLAEQKGKPIIILDQLARPNQHEKTEVVMVDRKEHTLFTRSPYLSTQLIESIQKSLSKGEQSLLYLNRRGTARLVLCENCGWQATCPHCDVPLTYHGDHHQLRCHSCDHHQPAPSSCPSCGHANIVYKTAGTKAIVSEVQKLFPQARVIRFDTDNIKAERFEQHYDAVRAGDFDILVGTQLIAKGLDLPKLTTLGILLADTSLYLPDFSAQERTYQLITQVLGRIGRGHLAGRAIIQSYHPDHPILQFAVGSNYDNFYNSELTSRKEFMFPPYCYLLKLTARRASIKSAENAAEKLKTEIEHSGAKVRVEGPAPSFYERIQNKFQWQLVVKSKDRNELIAVINSLPSGWSYDLDPLDLL